MLKFNSIRYGINLEKKKITCIIDVTFNHAELGLINALSPKEFRRLVSICGGGNPWRGFTVTGKAKCFKGSEDLPEDMFDQKKGERLAYQRAKRAALRRCRAILKYYNQMIGKISSELDNSVGVLNTMIDATEAKVEEILE